MRSVIYQSSDIVLRHLGELLLEDAFESREDDKALPLVIVVDNAKLYLAIALFDYGRL